VLTAMPAHGIPLGDILDDSGYSHRDADARALPLRAAGAQLIQDLHPDDRGPHGTHAGSIISNGNLYCPATPRPLLELGPLARDATPQETDAHGPVVPDASRGRAARLGLTTWPAPGLCPEPGIAGRVIVKLPHLADAAVPNVKDVRGVLVHPVAAALGELVM
jgi:hypothetical protein